jgi:HK97 family phage portal protein
MSIFTRIFERWQTGRVLAKLVPTWQQGRALPGPKDWARFADEGYNRNVIVHTCVREKATSTSEPAIDVRFVEGRELVATGPNDRLRRLLARPNGEQSGQEWIADLVTDLETFGNAYTHKLRSEAGVLVELWQLRPDRVEIVPGEDGRVQRYDYTVEGAAKAEPIEPEDVIHFSYPNPLDDYYGLSPIHVAALWGDVDNEAGDFLRAFFRNAGVPKGLLTLKGTVPDEERMRIKEAWVEQHGGKEGWHSVSVLDADAEYKSVGSTPSEFDLSGVFGESETRICSVFGVPPIIVAAKVGLDASTYSNYEQAKTSFWHETLVPLYRKLGDKLTHGLADEFGVPSRVVVFDLGGVEALQPDRSDDRRLALDAWNGGLITRNEGRAALDGLLDLELGEVDNGDVVKERPPEIVIPITSEPGTRPVEPEPVAAAASRGNGYGTDWGLLATGEEIDRLQVSLTETAETSTDKCGYCGHTLKGDDLIRRLDEAGRLWVHARCYNDWQKVGEALQVGSGVDSPVRRITAELERGIEAAVLAADAAMRGAADLDALESEIRQLDHDGIAALVPHDTWDVEFEAASWSALDIAERELRQIADAAFELNRPLAETISGIHDIAGYEKLQVSEAIEAARRQWTQTLQKQMRTTRTHMLAEFNKSVVSGVDPSVAARELVDGLGLTGHDLRQLEALRAKGATPSTLSEARMARLETRANRIANTESTRYAKMQQYADAEARISTGKIRRDEVVKIWRAVGPNPEELCVGLDGEEQPLTASFSEGVDGPPLHVNCQCVVEIETRRVKVGA